jgi:hypothetical protein
MNFKFQWITTPATIAEWSNFFFNLCGGTFGTAATTGVLYQPRIKGDGDCREIGGIKIGRGNRSSRRKPAPAPLSTPQIPHAYTRFWTRAAAVGSQRLTAWAMVRPAVWYKAWTVLARLDAGIVGSSPTRGMDVYVYVYVYSMFVLSCVGRGLATSWLLIQGVLPTVLD